MHLVWLISLLGSSLWFWQEIVSAQRMRSEATGLAAMFATMIHTGLLGALLTFTRQPGYVFSAENIFERAGWWLAPLEDQKVAGIMWVPMGLIYLGSRLAVSLTLLRPALTKMPVDPQRLASLTRRPRSLDFLADQIEQLLRP